MVNESSQKSLGQSPVSNPNIQRGGTRSEEDGSAADMSSPLSSLMGSPVRHYSAQRASSPTDLSELPINPLVLDTTREAPTVSSPPARSASRHSAAGGDTLASTLSSPRTSAVQYTVGLRNSTHHNPQLELVNPLHDPVGAGTASEGKQGPEDRDSDDFGSGVHSLKSMLAAVPDSPAVRKVTAWQESMFGGMWPADLGTMLDTVMISAADMDPPADNDLGTEDDAMLSQQGRMHDQLVSLPDRFQHVPGLAALQWQGLACTPLSARPAVPLRTQLSPCTP